VRVLDDYIQKFAADPASAKRRLATILRKDQASWDATAGKDPVEAFTGLVERYNWLGQPKNKKKYGIAQNLARNLPGALMQDFLIHVCVGRLEPYPHLEIFTEVMIPYGSYPVWSKGEVVTRSPRQRIDVAVGSRFKADVRVAPPDEWPRKALSKIDPGDVVYPLIALNSKIRVSQSEFFDWVGREELLTKGNPSCLSLQVALRSEMDLSIVELAQLSEQFCLLGRGGEEAVVGDVDALSSLIAIIDRHLEERMT